MTFTNSRALSWLVIITVCPDQRKHLLLTKWCLYCNCVFCSPQNIRTDIVMDGSFSINPAVDIGQVGNALLVRYNIQTLQTLATFALIDEGSKTQLHLLGITK